VKPRDQVEQQRHLLGGDGHPGLLRIIIRGHADACLRSSFQATPIAQASVFRIASDDAQATGRPIPLVRSRNKVWFGGNSEGWGSQHLNHGGPREGVHRKAEKPDEGLDQRFVEQGLAHRTGEGDPIVIKDPAQGRQIGIERPRYDADLQRIAVAVLDQAENFLGRRPDLVLDADGADDAARTMDSRDHLVSQR